MKHCTDFDYATRQHDSHRSAGGSLARCQHMSRRMLATAGSPRPLRASPPLQPPPAMGTSQLPPAPPMIDLSSRCTTRIPQ